MSQNIILDLAGRVVLTTEEYNELVEDHKMIIGASHEAATGWSIELSSEESRSKYPSLMPFNIANRPMITLKPLVEAAAEGYVMELCNEQNMDVVMRWAVERDAHYLDLSDMSLMSYRTETHYDLLKVPVFKANWEHYKDIIAKESEEV